MVVISCQRQSASKESYTIMFTKKKILIDKHKADRAGPPDLMANLPFFLFFSCVCVCVPYTNP